MNRDTAGKALHRYLSTSPLIFATKHGATQKNWGSLTEEIREEYRKAGTSFAQDMVYGGKYELSLEHLDEDQIIYNGLFSCVFPPHQQGWCHLLLLRSKDRETDDEEHVQKMAIVAQTPGSLLIIQPRIEQIATLIMSFFRNSFYTHPKDDITIIPENTKFIEYIPSSALNGMINPKEEPDKPQESAISIVRFQWEGEEGGYKASNPAWQHTSITAVNAMIQLL